MMRKLPASLLLLVVVASCTRAMSQDVDTEGARYPGREHHDELVLMTGYAQGRYGYGELGVGRSMHGITRHPYGSGYYLAAEVRMDRPEFVGVKVGAYVTGGFAMGMQLIQYTDGHDGCTVLRPELGIGLWKAKMTYAYNWRLTKPHVDGVSTHMLSITYAFRIARLPGDDDHRSNRGERKQIY